MFAIEVKGVEVEDVEVEDVEVESGSNRIGIDKEDGGKDWF